MDELIKKANDYIKSQNYLIIYSTFVRPASFMKISEILSITTYGFLVLSQKGNKIKNAYPFNDLTGVSVQENVVTLTFTKSTYSFESNDSNQIIYNIKDVIRHTLTVYEQQIINIDDFKIIPQVSQNGFAAECRLCNNTSQYPNQDKYLNEIKQILIYMQNTVKLSDYKFPGEIISPLLNVLPFSPYIEYLELPKLSHVDTYDIIRPFLKNNFYLKYLSIEGEKTKFFSEFLSLLKHNPYSKLNGHSFTNSDLGRTELDLLYKYCTDQKIQSLGFHSAIKRENFDYFYTSFLTPELFDSLYVLNLSGNPKIEIRKLLPRVRQICFLSLKDCQLEICDVLSSVSGMNRIKCIDLSNNKCSTTFNKTLYQSLKFPPSFDTLIIDNVSFTSSCIIPFFHFIFERFEHGLKLSVASLIMSGELWSQFFDFLSTTAFRSLVSLVWDKNQLNSKLFAFLLKNPYFESLSLNSCFSSNSSSDFINALGLFMQSSKTLKSLSVRGDDEKFLGSALNSLLKLVSSSKSLKFLDVSHSKCGDSGLANLTNFISQVSLSIEKLVFDDAMPIKKDSIMSLLKKAAKLKDTVLISFPENDVHRLVEEKVMTKDESSQLRLSFITSHVNENDDKNRHKSESFFAKSYNIYRYFCEEKFPYLIGQDEISRIANDRYLIDQVPERNSPKRISPKGQISSTSTRQQQKKQLQPTKNNFIIENSPEKFMRKPKNNIDEKSQQIVEFDTEKEKKRLNQSSTKKVQNFPIFENDDDQNIFKLNTKKRHAQSLRRQRKVTDNDDNDNNNKLLVNNRDVPRRTRTQSTRVKRKTTKNSDNKVRRSENTEKVEVVKDDIVERARKRRGRSVDSLNKNKNQVQFTNQKDLIKKKNGFDSDDYNPHSTSSTASFEDDQNQLKLKAKKNMKNLNQNDDDDLNVTAPILRQKTSNAKKSVTSNKSVKSTKQKSASSVKLRRKTEIKKIDEVNDDDSEDVVVNVRTPSRKSTSQKKKKPLQQAVSTPKARNNRKETVYNEGSSGGENDNDDDGKGEVINVEPIKYKPVEWKFPNLKVNISEGDFWKSFKSQFDADNLVEI